eukprot:18907-Heterococcus_DN1.PRE.5
MCCAAMALLWLLCVFFVLSLCQAYTIGDNVQSMRLQKQPNMNTCTSTNRRGLLQGAAAGLISTLAMVEPVLALTKPKREPVARLPEEFDTPQLKGLSSDENPTLAAFRTLPSGVQVTDIQEGTGLEVTEGSTVTLQWVIATVYAGCFVNVYEY